MQPSSNDQHILSPPLLKFIMENFFRFSLGEGGAMIFIVEFHLKVVDIDLAKSELEVLVVTSQLSGLIVAWQLKAFKIQLFTSQNKKAL